MSYRPFKKPAKAKIQLRKLEDYDLYFESVPPAAIYKFKKTMNRNMRKLKFA